MTNCFFVADLHGHEERYEKLFAAILQEKPQCVFMGGDILPSGLKCVYRSAPSGDDFLNDYLIRKLSLIRQKMGANYPRIFLILGNDDSRRMENRVQTAESLSVWEYMHMQKKGLRYYNVYGYSCVPPTPFLSKDWERYDVSRYVDPGAISPEEGFHSTPKSKENVRYGTIQDDLRKLTKEDDLASAVMLFHTPPYQTSLDRAALDGKMIDHVELDVHVGSIAVRRFIEKKQPWITLHGHIHEAPRITGHWWEKIGRTHMFTAAHDGRELALIRFPLEDPERATRELL